MSVNLSPVAGAAAQFLDNSGNVLTGGKLYTYAAGTTTPQATYTSGAGVTFHSNPIILDAAGRVPNGGEIWLTDGLQYKFVLKDANDVLIGTWDNLIGINSNFLNYYTQQEIQTATAGQTVFTLTTLTYTPGTNSLSVFVDGVNQYDGISYAYVETDSTTVTFTAGLHVGALVKFTTAVTLSSGVTTADLVTYDPPFTGSVPTTVELKLAQTVSVKDFGATGNGVTDDTAAFVSAIGNGNVNVFVPQGVYKVSTFALKSFTNLFGDGVNSVIRSDGSANNTITAQYVNRVTIQNLQVRGNATKTNLCGIYIDGAVWTTLENLYVRENGSHGIQFIDTGTAYAGCYPVMVKGVHSVANIGDGFRQVGTSGFNQQNAVEITQSEFQSNGGNGLTLWGTSINVSDSVTEGNTGWGAYFDNGLSSGLYSATSMSVKNCYFEANTAGHIGGRVGTYGVISCFEFIGNIFISSTSVTGIGYVPVKFTNYSSTLNAIRNLNFENNQYLITGTDLTTYADFGDAPSISCRIVPAYGGTVNVTQLTSVPAQYINIGYSTFKYFNSLVLNGYWFAKGGSGITYSSSAGSDSITVSGSNTNFPVQVPVGSTLAFFAVPVDTDCASYTINMYLRSRAYNSTSLSSVPAVTVFASGTGATSQLVSTPSIATYGSPLVTTGNSEMILSVTVTWASPGTYFRLGAPTIYYVSP